LIGASVDVFSHDIFSDDILTGSLIIFIIISVITVCIFNGKKYLSVKKIKEICNIITDEEALLTFSYEVCYHLKYVQHAPTFFESDLHQRGNSASIQHNHCKVYSRSETVGNGTMQYTYNPVSYPTNKAEHHCQLYTRERTEEQFIRLSLKATNTSTSRLRSGALSEANDLLEVPMASGSNTDDDNLSHDNKDLKIDLDRCTIRKYKAKRANLERCIAAVQHYHESIDYNYDSKYDDDGSGDQEEFFENTKLEYDDENPMGAIINTPPRMTTPILIF